ncbi:CvpA family protein [Sulfurimonas sp. SWIR-19]|uniref:CvpA family protein n=1 Tax=Sulfurimonas sp. SWIR-19 TaxID=2878390 RepID=UPI001CF4DAF1|nr:CvpA family protein [Sulfurimonas sp. SWIR-19]UCN01215.1 CvpA family protein [Sulfurimonas sp. SWIR-19]
MEFNYFDIIVGVIILLLGLKGILNGFFKEIFGLIGIIGGIFVASRFGDNVGLYLSNTIFKFSNESAISFTGFLATLALFWLVMVLIGFAFKKLSSLSGLGPIDKILGFIVGSSKFFLIAAVIAYAVYNVKAIRTTLDSALKTSILFPVLVETGKYIMKIDPTDISNDINTTISQGSADLQQKVEDNISAAALQQIETIKNQIKEK